MLWNFIAKTGSKKTTQPIQPGITIRLSSDSLYSCVPSLEAPVMCGPSCLLAAGLLCVLTTVAQALQCYSCGPHSDQV